MNSYWQRSRSNSYNFIFAFVLFLLYHGAVFLMQAVGRGQVINGVDALFQQMLGLVPPPFSLYVYIGIGVAVFVAGATWIYKDRQNEIELKRGTFIWMFLESCVWAAVLFMIMPMFIQKLLTGMMAVPLQAPGGEVVVAEPTWLENVGLSFGAGFYEELFFRLMLVRGLQWLVSRTGRDGRLPLPTTVIVIIAALAFSGVHYIGSLGDDFTIYSFIYRFIMGILFSLLLVARRFGITAWTHAMYDVYVFTARAFLA